MTDPEVPSSAHETITTTSEPENGSHSTDEPAESRWRRIPLPVKLGFLVVVSPALVVAGLLVLSGLGDAISGVWPIANSRLLNHDEFDPAVWVNLYGGLLGSAMSAGIAAYVAMSVLQKQLNHERDRADMQIAYERDRSADNEQRRLNEYRLKLIDELSELMTNTATASTWSDIKAASGRFDRIVSRFNRSFSTNDDRGVYLGNALSWGAETFQWITRDQYRFDHHGSWLFKVLIPAVQDVARVVDVRSLAPWAETGESLQTKYMKYLSYNASEKLTELRKFEIAASD